MMPQKQRTPHIRVKVEDVDKLLLLSESRLKVWLYYKRRYGADGKAWGKASEIAKRTGLRSGTVRNARSWLVKNGWLKPNGNSNSGLPMFVPVIGGLQGSSSNDGRHPEITGASSGNDRVVTPELQGVSFEDETEVTTPEAPTPEAPTSEVFRPSDGSKHEGRDREVSSADAASTSPPSDQDENYSAYCARHLTKQETLDGCSLVTSLFPSQLGTPRQCVMGFETRSTLSIDGIDPKALLEYNHAHMTGGLYIRTIEDFHKAVFSVGDDGWTKGNGLVARYKAHDPFDCKVCAKRTLPCLICGKTYPKDNCVKLGGVLEIKGINRQTGEPALRSLCSSKCLGEWNLIVERDRTGENLEAQQMTATAAHPVPGSGPKSLSPNFSEFVPVEY